MPTQLQIAELRKSLRQVLLEQLIDALLHESSADHVNTPILRLEAFIQDGREPGIADGESPSRQPIISVCHSNPYQ